MICFKTHNGDAVRQHCIPVFVEEPHHGHYNRGGVLDYFFP